MNDLTTEQFEAAPKLVQWLYIMASQGWGVSIDKYNEIKHKHPSYFEAKNNSVSVAQSN